jgi:hypothetical protein
VGLAGHVADVGACGGALGRDIAPEHPRGPGARGDQPEQDADRGRLAGSVGADEAEDRLRRDAEADLVAAEGSAEVEIVNGRFPRLARTERCISRARRRRTRAGVPRILPLLAIDIV